MTFESTPVTGHEITVHPHTLSRVYSAHCECGQKFQTGTYPALRRRMAGHIARKARGIVAETCMDCGRNIAPDLPTEVVGRLGLIVPTPDRTCRICLAGMGYLSIDAAKREGRRVHR